MMRGTLLNHDPSTIAVVAMTLARLAEAMLTTGFTLPVVPIDLELDAGPVSRTALYAPAVTFVVADNRSRRCACGHCQEGCTNKRFADDVHECLHFSFGYATPSGSYGSKEIWVNVSSMNIGSHGYRRKARTHAFVRWRRPRW